MVVTWTLLVYSRSYMDACRIVLRIMVQFTYWFKFFASCRFNKISLSVHFCYEAVDYGERMEWDESFKGLVLSAFTYGYMSTQIIGGRMTEVYGVKKVRISIY